MNKSEFLSTSNIEILWEVIVENIHTFKNKSLFETELTEFYQRENHKHSDLVFLNKAFISSILAGSSLSPPPPQPQSQSQRVPITFEELHNEKLLQFEIQLTEKEEDFKQSMTRSLPEKIPNFRDKMDEPLTEIESIMKRTIAERNYDIAQIVNANATEGKMLLQPQETSIKKEKLSPLFFSQNKAHLPKEEERHISWDKEIKKDYIYNYNLLEPIELEPETKETKETKSKEMPLPNNRIYQMKQIHDNALEVFRKKNTDYGDSFATYGITGILIRIEDKLRRAISINKNGVTLVKDEGFRDTLLDLHNYAAMGLMLLDEDE